MLTSFEVMRRYPRVTAHVICESFGYASPLLAARIVADAKAGRENWCEWIAACFGCHPKEAVARAIKYRRFHRRIAGYPLALALVRCAVSQKIEPPYASRF